MNPSTSQLYCCYRPLRSARRGFLGRLIPLVVLLVLAGEFSVARAQFHGSRGPTFVRSAWNLEPGYLTVYTHTRFYGKVSEIQGLQKTAVAFWNVQGGLSINYGISRHFEASILPMVYQDTNRGGRGFNVPDDVFLRLKIASFGQRGGTMSYGVELGTRLPTAETHNVRFEPYSAGKVSFGIHGMASYARDPLYPEDGISLHLNLGYWNHNDVGEQLSSADPSVDSVRVTSMTQEFTYGAALVLPSDRFNFRFEFFGRGFINAPPGTAFSREPVVYLSPGVSYKPYRWMTLDFSSDVRLSGDDDNTDYSLLNKIPGLPNYSTWRISLGLKLTLLPSSVYSLGERDLLMQKAESRRELFEQIIKEQRETEAAEAELERIKDERRKAERELERLRRILEGEARRQQEEEYRGNDNDSPPL